MVVDGSALSVDIPIEEAGSIFEAVDINTGAVDVNVTTVLNTMTSTGLAIPPLVEAPWFMLYVGGITAVGANTVTASWFIISNEQLRDLEPLVAGDTVTSAANTDNVLTFPRKMGLSATLYIGRTEDNEFLMGSGFVTAGAFPFIVRELVGFSSTTVGSLDVDILAGAWNNTNIKIPSIETKWLLLNFGASTSSGQHVSGAWHLVETQDLRDLATTPSNDDTINAANQSKFLAFPEANGDGGSGAGIVYVGRDSNDNILITCGVNQDFYPFTVNTVNVNLAVEEIGSSSIAVTTKFNFYPTGITIPDVENYEWLLINLGLGSSVSTPTDTPRRAGEWHIVRTQDLLDLPENTEGTIGSSGFIQIFGSVPTGTVTNEGGDIALARLAHNELAVANHTNSTISFAPLTVKGISAKRLGTLYKLVVDDGILSLRGSDNTSSDVIYPASVVFDTEEVGTYGHTTTTIR